MNIAEFPDLGTLDEQILFALHYAVRAPSTHNSQPWLFRIGAKTVEVHADWAKKLPYGDKDGRDMCISVGACIEHAKAAFSYFGMLEDLVVNEAIILSENKPIAIFTVHRSTGTDEMLLPTMHAIESRFNARGPFLKKEIPLALLHGLKAASEPSVSFAILTDHAHIMRFADLTGEGMRVAHRIPEFRGEIAKWMINNYSKKNEGIPGYTMLAPGLLSLILPTLIGRFNLGGILSKLNHLSIASSSGVLVFSSKDTPSNWVHVGMLFARMSLALNVEYIHTSVYCASIEMPDIRVRLKDLLPTDEAPQFACAFGYPKIMLRQSPRHEPKDRMIQ